MSSKLKEQGDCVVVGTLTTDKLQYGRKQESHFEVHQTLGHYSLDTEFRFTKSCLGLRRLIADRRSIIGQNIWHGFDEDESDKELNKHTEYSNTCTLSQIIQWEKDNAEVLDGVDFVLKRGQLRRILKSPYSEKDDMAWHSDVVKKDGRIYISEKAKPKTASMSTEHKKFSYGGYTFEKLIGKLTDSESDTEPSKDGRYYSVYLAEMSGTSPGPFRFLMSGEIDGTDGPDDVMHDFRSFVEVKAFSEDTVLVEDDKVSFTFFKKYDSWLSCYMSGIEKLCVGVRDQDGNICDVHMLNPMQDLQGIEPDKAVTMNFASSFFYWVKAVVTKENVVYRFSFDPKESFVSCKQLFGEEADILNVLQK